MHSFQAASAGQRDREAVNFLEKKMKNNPSLTFQETIEVRVFLFIESKLDEGMQHLL
jgi:20S proteasome subunit alpha 1